MAEKKLSFIICQQLKYEGIIRHYCRLCPEKHTNSKMGCKGKQTPTLSLHMEFHFSFSHLKLIVQHLIKSLLHYLI